MGHHYVPQQYLRGFSTPEDARLIWMYEKGERYASCAAISRVAQERGFYTEQTEGFLARQIELPANAVLARLRAREHITGYEREALARYMDAMLKRVPRHRGRLEKLAPGVLASVFADFDGFISGEIRKAPEDRERWERLRTQARQLQASYDERIPDDLWRELIQPRLSARIVDALVTMRWIFLTRECPPFFLTGDNPVFYFETIGLANELAEVSFPIARDIALWATRRPDIRQGMAPADSQLVKEFNRRTINITTRFVFHSLREDWVVASLNRRHHPINPIRPRKEWILGR